MTAGGRMHAVRSDQEIALGAGAIGEVGHNRLIGPVFDVDQAFFERYLDILAPGRRQDRLKEGGAAHVHRGLAETLLHILVDRAEPAFPIANGTRRLPRSSRGWIISSARPISASTCMPFGAICRPPPMPVEWGQASNTCGIDAGSA